MSVELVFLAVVAVGFVFSTGVTVWIARGPR